MVSNNGLAGPGHANEGPSDSTLYAPSLGQLRGIVLWVDFSDAPATESIATLTDQLVPPAEAGYTAMSCGSALVPARAALDVLRAERSRRAWPQGPVHRRRDPCGRRGHRFQPVRRRLLGRGRGRLRRHDHRDRTDHLPGSPLTVADGKEIRHAVLIGSHRLQEPRHGSDGILHETGHVLGLPDLYGDYTAVGGSDPMSFNVTPAAELMGWQRWKLGWLDAPQIRCVQPGRTVEATLMPLETAGGVKMLVAPLDANRALVLENRQPLGNDARLCDKGVLAHTVDGTITYSGSPIHVLPAHPGTDTDGSKQQQCSPRYDAPLDFGTGETSSLVVPQSGVSIQLMSTAGDAYIVRVSRSPWT